MNTLILIICTLAVFAVVFTIGYVQGRSASVREEAEFLRGRNPNWPDR